jgi:hypothetical protein
MGTSFEDWQKLMSDKKGEHHAPHDIWDSLSIRGMRDSLRSSMKTGTVAMSEVALSGLSDEQEHR